ncbi:uncharacterized protein BP5553_05701 [Venustampulla echinocandica]|uniref:Transcription factor tau subunit sfc1 n=1 Tax=Venustampulla echinocandica TaxID=2656787 RepID=A0A370TLF8_9HELO|nr:uncharacterized protein BP5553_05701 [Venustampulla echinocandica]RDL36349.1 hypothetical protein BP5553_05701 [Venustampulla echinocandica]
MAAKPSAAAFNIDPREVVAVEHPMIIKNLDNALKTFGTNRPFERMIESDDIEECVPLYLRRNDPMCVPVLSYHSFTNNVLLKITVPRRTGRKRKRGSQDPYVGHSGEHASSSRDDVSAQTNIRSLSRMDAPSTLSQSLRDNIGSYKIEPVAQIKQTHRFRGLADFHHSTDNTTFLPHFQETALTGQVDKIRQFALKPERGWRKNDEFMPPPAMSSQSLPFNWGWHQNPHVQPEIDETTGKEVLRNRSKAKKAMVDYLAYDAASIPHTHPYGMPEDADLQALVGEIEAVMEERPIWTRRALTNRVANSPFLYQIRHAFRYVGYQFRGGPWRDAIIKFGVDPRSDKKYRSYQTMFFKLFDEEEKHTGRVWHDVRTGYSVSKRNAHDKINQTTHLFDGKSLTLDGKIFQVCDVTDPLLAQLMRDAPYSDTCDPRSDGWFVNGAWAKIKAIMRTKLTAVRLGKEVPDDAFKISLSMPDIVPGRNSRKLHIPVPDIGITEEEMKELKGRSGLSITQRSIKKRNNKQKKRSERIRPKISNKDYQPRGEYQVKTERYIERMNSVTPDERARVALEQLKRTGVLGEKGVVSVAGKADKKLDEAAGEDIGSDLDADGDGDDVGDSEMSSDSREDDEDEEDEEDDEESDGDAD